MTVTVLHDCGCVEASDRAQLFLIKICDDKRYCKRIRQQRKE